MNRAGEILSITPKYAIPSAELVIACDGFRVGQDQPHAVFFDDSEARILVASSRIIVVEVPDGLESEEVAVRLECGGDRSEAYFVRVGRKVVDDMHIVANPAIDPADGSLIVTRSGSRGQQMDVTLFRVDTDGFVSDIAASVLNPTGIAFDRSGGLFVTNRADGIVCRVERDEFATTFASNLGIATGIAFDGEGVMYVGDRAGIIHRISDFGGAEVFANLEPSVAAFHMAFGPDDRLYVTSPGLSSFDAVYAVDRAGFETKYFKGLGRPQGLAFDVDGNLYVAACFRGARGIVKISPGGEDAELIVAGNNVVGLCFDRAGKMLIATNREVYSLELGIKGALLG